MDEFERQIRDVYRNQEALDSLDKIECMIYFEEKFDRQLTEEEEEEFITSVITLDDAVAFFKKLAP